jgi:hypothetical protein
MATFFALDLTTVFANPQSRRYTYSSNQSRFAQSRKLGGPYGQSHHT